MSIGLWDRYRSVFTRAIFCICGIFLFVYVTPANAQTIGPIAPDQAVAPITAAPADETNNDLVLQIFVNNQEMQDFIEGIERNGKSYISLTQLSSLLDFPITVDPAQKTANGWFINERNKIQITPQSATVKDEQLSIGANDIIFNDHDIFVSIDLLQKWFPLSLGVNTQAMTLQIATKEDLPFQQKIKRKQAYANLEAQKKEDGPLVEKKIETPYAATQWPSVDLTFSPSYQAGDNSSAHSNYSIIAGGDLGYMTSHLYAAGDLNDDMVSDVRMNFGRSDYNRDLLGPLHASSFLFGDINANSLQQVTSAGQGRGFTVTNRALNRSDKFDITSFVGDTKPGWDVELYRNDALIAFQTVGTSGRYEFKDIPVLFGNNIFKLVFYGAQGQKEEITKTINADSSLLEKGEFSYNISADQKSKTLIAISEDEDDGDLRGVTEFEYGLSKKLTVALGSASTVVNNERRTYVTSGLRASFGGVLGSVDTAYNTGNGGHSTRLSVFDHFLGLDVRLLQKVAHNFVSESDNNTGNPVELQTALGLNKEITLPGLGGFMNDLLLTRKEYQSGRVEKLATYQLSKSFLGLSFTNTLDYDSDNLGMEQLGGNMSLRGTFNRIQLGVQLDYNATPDSQITDGKITCVYPIAEGIAGNASLSKDFAGDGVEELENTVTFDMKKYRLSLTGRASTDDNYYLGMTINTSIGKIPDSNAWMFSSKPVAETGTLAIRPYLDLNYNQARDPGEEALPGIAFKVGGMATKSNKRGEAVATQLPVNLPVAVTVDEDAKENPNWSTPVNKYEVFPRGGRIITLDYPLFETSQIDGTIHADVAVKFSALLVELLNTEGQSVASTHPAFDGYYLLDNVMPGTYRIRIKESDLNNNHLVQTEDRTLVIDKSDFYTQDITLQSNDAPAEAPTMPAAESKAETAH